jgi:hypothetical protein
VITVVVLGGLGGWTQPAKKKATNIINSAFTFASYACGRTTSGSDEKIEVRRSTTGFEN